MKKKGQALVEFIIILPLVLLLLLGIVDIGKILYTKITLEDTMSEVVTLYENNKTPEEILEELDLPKTTLTVKEKDEYLNLTLTKDISIITPGLNLIFKNPYKLTVMRSILNETQ